jgi:hypothetical protein
VNELFDNKLIWAPIELKDGDTVLDSGTGSGMLDPKKGRPAKNKHLWKVTGYSLYPNEYPRQ